MNSPLRTLILLAALGASALPCQQLSAQSKDAEPATRAANDAFVKSLPFADRADFDDAKRGFIATLPDGVIAGIGGKPGSDGALTATEQRIIALAAAGQTSREVASALFLSVRTVDSHLGHIYRKLGLRSRTELALWASAHPLPPAVTPDLQ